VNNATRNPVNLEIMTCETLQLNKYRASPYDTRTLRSFSQLSTKPSA